MSTDKGVGNHYSTIVASLIFNFEQTDCIPRYARDLSLRAYPPPIAFPTDLPNPTNALAHNKPKSRRRYDVLDLLSRKHELAPAVRRARIQVPARACDALRAHGAAAHLQLVDDDVRQREGHFE